MPMQRVGSFRPPPLLGHVAQIQHQSTLADALHDVWHRYRTRQVGADMSLLQTTVLELSRNLLVTALSVFLGGFVGRESSTLLDWATVSPARSWWAHCQLGALVCLAVVGACSVVLLLYHVCAVRLADVPVRILLDCCLYRRAHVVGSAGKSSSGEDCCRGLLLTFMAIGAVVILFAAVYLILTILDKRNQFIRSQYMDIYQVIDYGAE